MTDHRMDWDREARTGTAEAVLCAGKSDRQVAAILAEAVAQERRLLLTRLEPERVRPLEAMAEIDYEPVGRTAILGPLPEPVAGVGIVAAGTSDVPVATEAARTLAFHGYTATITADVGVAGLSRLLDQVEALKAHKVLIAVAGMEGALFSVLSGLVSAPVIAVPSPVGYGVSEGGRLALDAALGSCAAGLTVVNIGNGFGAACAAIRMLRMAGTLPGGEGEGRTLAGIAALKGVLS